MYKVIKIREETYELLQMLAKTYDMPMSKFIDKVIRYIAKLPKEEILKILYSDIYTETQQAKPNIRSEARGTEKVKVNVEAEAKSGGNVQEVLMRELEENPWVSIIRARTYT